MFNTEKMFLGRFVISLPGKLGEQNSGREDVVLEVALKALNE